MKREYDEKKLHSYIRSNQLNSYLSSDIYPISELLQFDKNEYLVEAGYPADYLYFLVAGEIVISACSTNDRNTCISYCRHFTIIGEAASLWRLPPRRSVRALTRCTCIAINLKRHRQLLQNDLLFLQNICQILTYKLNAENELSYTLYDSLEVRLARFILEYSVNQMFSFQLTNCAYILNTSYRHLLRVLKIFCSMGLLKKAKNCYIIENAGELALVENGGLKITGDKH